MSAAGFFEHAGSLHGYWQEGVHSLEGERHVIDISHVGIVAAIELAPLSGGVRKRGMQLFHKYFDNGASPRDG